MGNQKTIILTATKFGVTVLHNGESTILKTSLSPNWHLYEDSDLQKLKLAKRAGWNIVVEGESIYTTVLNNQLSSK